jgi:hypothetical protein
MNFSTFEYSLAFISIILIITIIVIIFYKKYEDAEQDLENPAHKTAFFKSRVKNNNENDKQDLEKYIKKKDDNKDTYLKVNMNTNMNTSMDIEHFYNAPYQQSSIDSIFVNNSNISTLISSLNSLSNNNPSLNMKYRKFDIDNNLQLNIADSLNTNTDDLINRVDDGSDRINKKVTTLTNQITDLEHIIEKLHLKTIIKPNYSKIKSLNNGAEITLSQTPNSFYLDPGSGVNTAAYMVNLNDGCLSVGATDYDVYKCNDANSKHLFKMEHVINETGYQKNIDKTVPFNNTDISTINYPFVLMRSVNNKNCLTNQNGNITVQPCDTLTAQRWLPV